MKKNNYKGSKLKKLWKLVTNKKYRGVYSFIWGLVATIVSIFIGVRSLNVSKEALVISKKTSERDSITSIQMDKNRKNDSIAYFRNNFRDSLQQEQMVLLLEKYNRLADEMLQTQMDAEKPKFTANILSISDTIIATNLSGKFRMPFIDLTYMNYANRPAHNLNVRFELYFPNSKMKYYDESSPTDLFGKNQYRGYLIPVIPLEDKEYFFIKLKLTWEDHLLGMRLDSSKFSFFARTVDSKKLKIFKVSNKEKNALDILEKSAKYVDFSEVNYHSMINTFYRSCLENWNKNKNN